MLWEKILVYWKALILVPHHFKTRKGKLHVEGVKIDFRLNRMVGGFNQLGVGTVLVQMSIFLELFLPEKAIIISKWKWILNLILYKWFIPKWHKNKPLFIHLQCSCFCTQPKTQCTQLNDDLWFYFSFL